ncbi:MAG TPA: substrate-binding domain-containing protein [Xanthobacteraceae bacterium]|nr:substrate-binding domain-containing protein [Xanthobacteraceae bacterium]
MTKLKAGLAASAILMSFGATQSAHAQYAYGGGATFPSIVYRQLLDCLYTPADGAQGGPAGPMAMSPACPFPNGQGIGYAAHILYAPVGSGAGKRALINNDASNTSTGLGTPAAANTVPYTHSGAGGSYPYPFITFAGSDDVWTSADQTNWVNKGNLATFGRVVQIPMLAGPVAVAFNGKDGNGNNLNINPGNYNPPGASSQLNLSRQAVCGIFSGHITKWDNPILTALNGGTPLGTGNITVVHRSDGSGTTFIMTNGLATQCQFAFGPNNESDATLVSYAFPWTDRTVSASQCSTTLLQPRGANAHNWPDLVTNQCGVAISNPGGGLFAAGSGNAGVVAAVQATNGAVGYATADFIQPVAPSGPAAANIESQWDIANGTGEFQAATVAGTQQAMASAVPVFDDTTRTNALAWSLQGVSPNPALAGSYPFAGFTWLDMYQCYENNPFNDGKTLVNIFLNYLHGAPDAQAIVEANGFSTVPYNWLQEIYALFASDDAPTYVGTGGCTGVSPGARNG